jgi:hypothetical protein
MVLVKHNVVIEFVVVNGNGNEYVNDVIIRGKDVLLIILTRRR